MINKYNQLSKQQSDFIEKANNVTRSIYELLIKWQELGEQDENLVCENYPFTESLDEVWATVSDWNENLIYNFQKASKFSPTINVGQMKKILDGLDDEEQIVIWDERKLWWLNIESVEVPDQESLFTLVLYPKDTFDTRQI